MTNTRKLIKKQLLEHAKNGMVPAGVIKDLFKASGGDPEKVFKILELNDGEVYNVEKFVEWLHAPVEKKLMIYSSRTPDKADFKECLKCPGLEYDWETATAETLTKMIADAKDEMTDDEGFDNIAFACHGPPAPAGETLHWAITKSAVLTSSMTNLGDVGKVLKALACATKKGGRVDLLACNLLKDDFGKDVLKKIESRTSTNFAASSNVTGNPKNGGDWVMESDGINIGPIYFKNLETFGGTFENPYRNVDEWGIEISPEEAYYHHQQEQMKLKCDGTESLEEFLKMCQADINETKSNHDIKDWKARC